MPNRSAVQHISSTPRKRGRPQKPYRTSWGDNIDGLRYREHDKRWLIVATGQMFREPDERLAVSRFHRIQASADAPPVVHVDVGTFHDTLPAVVKGLNEWGAGRRGIKLNRPLGNEGPIVVSSERAFDVPEYWAWLRQEIIANPKLVAQKVGIEQIGYLADLKPPADKLTLVDALQVYGDFAKVSRDEHARIRRAWEEFSGIVGVDTVADVTNEVAEQYESALGKLALAPKTTKHRIGAVRTVLAFCIKRGKGVVHCRAALDALAMLTVKNANPLDPRPIAVDDFWSIYKAARKAGDKPFVAMLLLGLNCAMYSSEVALLKWSDLDLKRGTLATRRNKTNVPRIAVLWPETLQALEALTPHESISRVFYTLSGGPVYRQLINRGWLAYRGAAGVADDVVFSQLRDAAFTVAAQHDIDQARLLNGHKLAGAADNYVLRQPRAVAEVCEAIRGEFKVAEHVRRVR